jgi:hypothetical protein
VTLFKGVSALRSWISGFSMAHVRKACVNHLLLHLLLGRTCSQPLAEAH